MDLIQAFPATTVVSTLGLLAARLTSRRAIALGLTAALLSLLVMAPVAHAHTDATTAHSAAAPGEDQNKDLDPDALAREAVHTARSFAFPLVLALVVLAFLVIQGLVDRGDPRLAHPPDTPAEDMVGFE